MASYTIMISHLFIIVKVFLIRFFIFLDIVTNLLTSVGLVSEISLKILVFGLFNKAIHNRSCNHINQNKW